jgi:hypothetical protein
VTLLNCTEAHFALCSFYSYAPYSQLLLQRVSPKDGISELLLDTVRQKTGVSQLAQQAPAAVLAAAGYKPRVCTPLSHMAGAVLGFDTTASAGELVDIVGAVVQVCLNIFLYADYKCIENSSYKHHWSCRQPSMRRALYVALVQGRGHAIMSPRTM